MIGFDLKKSNKDKQKKTSEKVDNISPHPTFPTGSEKEEGASSPDSSHAPTTLAGDANPAPESAVQVKSTGEGPVTVNKTRKSLKPAVVIPSISESIDGIQETVESLQEQMSSTATAAWNNLFSAISVKNPFMKIVASSPKGFGVILKDDVFIPVRAVHDVEDAELIKKFLEGLTPESRYLRFHQSMPIVRDSTANYLAHRDGHTRVALIGLSPEEPEPGQGRNIIVMVEYILDGEEPEVAIAVADEWQGKGLGGEMLKLLATLSIAGGHKKWRAEVLNENIAVVKILKKVGKVKLVQTSMGNSTYHVHLQAAKIFT